MDNNHRKSGDKAWIGDKPYPEQARDEGGVGSHGGQRAENRFDNPDSRRPKSPSLTRADDDPRHLDDREEELKEERMNRDPSRDPSLRGQEARAQRSKSPNRRRATDHPASLKAAS